MIADRRFAYGEAAMADGDLHAARDLFQQVVELVPGWPPAHFMLGKVERALDDRGAAHAAFEACLALDPADRLGAGLLLAQESASAPGPGAMPDAYVAALFDEYAPRFDNHLIRALDYRAPDLLRAVLERFHAVRHPPARHPYARFLDLGCGSGLMARALAGHFEQAIGIDLSAGMLREAEATGLYARLECASLLDVIGRTEPRSCDLVVAADVFCYVPDLSPVFSGVAHVLARGGHFAFTIQTHNGEGAVIGADARVHHASALVRTLASVHGFRILHDEAVSTRKDRGIPVPGALFLLAKL